jgi:hypothetical protein
MSDFLMSATDIDDLFGHATGPRCPDVVWKKFA